MRLSSLSFQHQSFKTIHIPLLHDFVDFLSLVLGLEYGPFSIFFEPRLGLKEAIEARPGDLGGFASLFDGAALFEIFDEKRLVSKGNHISIVSSSRRF